VSVTVLHIQSKTDSDGKLEVVTGVPDAHVNLVVMVDGEKPAGPVTDEDWVRTVLALEGSIGDPTFRRHPEGKYPVREPLL
jgi:hypothetical protein